MFIDGRLRSETLGGREIGRRLAVGFILAVGACFGGGFVQGLPCESDADCGPNLACIERLCGGPGEAAVCGNGLTDRGEECDDGNLNDGDACSRTCLLPPVCGNGVVQEGEACDDGNTVETDDCTTKCTLTPGAPTLELGFAQVKQFEFSWEPVPGASHYRLFERADVGAAFVQVGGDIAGDSYSLTVPLHFRVNASYKLSACNESRCTESEVVDVAGTLAEAIGYFKASNTDAGDLFGASVALSGDGTTLAVGAYQEDGGATGNGGDQGDDSAVSAGAVYVFVRTGEGWSQQAYIKASNTDARDGFGWAVALSKDGNTLAVGATDEGSKGTGVDGDQSDDSADVAGAVYVFVRAGEVWSQQAYIKASNTGAGDTFGWGVALSGDGNTLAVGAVGEGSDATGIDGDQNDDSADDAGAVYVFVRVGESWSQQAYVKASNTDASDGFGWSVALSGDGDTLAVSAVRERSNAAGVDGDQDDDTADLAGAVYVFMRAGESWSEQAYVKASNTDAGDFFGSSVALSGDGDTLAVGAEQEGSGAVGIDGDQDDDSAAAAGAVYVFVRVGASWSQQAYVKASNAGAGDLFGASVASVALSGDGKTMAIGAVFEDSDATGVGSDQDDDSALENGAVYVFVQVGETWSQQAYVKASRAIGVDGFGGAVALSEAGTTLAVGAFGEHYGTTGIGNQSNIVAFNAGAVYLY